MNLNPTDPPVSQTANKLFMSMVIQYRKSYTLAPRTCVCQFFLIHQTGDPSSTGVTSEAAPEAHLVIWGTDVNIQDTKRQFREFLENFMDDLPGEGGDSPIAEDKTEPYYMQRLDEVNSTPAV